MEEIYRSFFEQVIGGLVHEIYFPEEIKKAGKNILEHIGDLKPFKEAMSEEENLPSLKLNSTVCTILHNRSFS